MISVVIPTYNRAHYLSDALRSCLAQGVDDIEIVVADDGSTDDTAAVVAGFAPHVEYLALPHCGRPGTVRNRALERTHGDFVAFLDSDDLFLAGKLARQQAALVARPEAAIAYSDGVFFTDDPRQPSGRVLDGLPRPDGDAVADLLCGNFLFPATVLARRKHVQAVGGFDEAPTLRGAEDYDLWLRLAARGAFAFVAGAAAAVRRHPHSLSADTAAIRTAAVAALRKFQGSHPELAARHRAALHEGYARHHAAVATTLLARGDARGLGQALAAAGHALRAPRRVATALAAWRKRRHLRRAARPPAVGRGGEA